jgi:hypothetical protein
MEAWLNCENLLISLSQQPTTYSHQTQRIINECADICLTALHAIKNQYSQLEDLTLLCIGICEECAEVCERYEGMLFKTCANTCRQCSNVFAQLASPTI